MNRCETCDDTGRVKTIFDAGTMLVPQHDPDARAESCPHCRECPRCTERAPNGEFERPYPEDEPMCAGCVDDIRNYSGRDGDGDHVPNWNER